MSFRRYKDVKYEDAKQAIFNEYKKAKENHGWDFYYVEEKRNGINHFVIKNDLGAHLIEGFDDMSKTQFINVLHLNMLEKVIKKQFFYKTVIGNGNKNNAIC